MGAMQDVGQYLVSTLSTLYIMVVLLRFLLQLARADFYNPISQFVVRATDPLLRPLRKVIPGLAGLDIASLVLALLLQWAAINIIYLIYGFMPHEANAIVWAVLGVAASVVKIYFFSIIVAIIFSWIAPGSYHPALILLNQINEPVMAPFRRILPPMGGLDWSPILVFIVINVINILLARAAVATGLQGGLLLVL